MGQRGAKGGNRPPTLLRELFSGHYGFRLAGPPPAQLPTDDVRASSCFILRTPKRGK